MLCLKGDVDMEKIHKKNVRLSVLLVLFMLFAMLGTTGFVSGDESEDDLDIDDYLFLETGTRDSKDDWDRGDYVAINMTKNGALSWFGVIYGTEEDPNGILIFCAYIRFLGAAEVYEANGEFIGRYPIPIITVFGQRLAVLFEFKDDGKFSGPIPGTHTYNETYENNGVFDFVKRDDNQGLWAISDEHETVTKAINLQRAWTRSEEVTEIRNPEDPTTMSWEFSLWAENISYGIETEEWGLVLDDPDNTVDKLEFTFHITANVDEVNITGVPWYEVTVDSGNHKSVIDTEYKESRDYVGTSVTSDFKFDHLIEGWDYSGGDGLVLINHGFFANGIPKQVADWLGEQFMYKLKGGGEAVYDALDPNQEDAVSAVVSTNATEDLDADGDGIVDAKLVSKDVITFKDNWQEVGELTWISNAEVDGEDKNVTYQVHGGQSFNEEFENKDGYLRGFIIQGGYIYPAGNNIYHDPSLVAIALLFSPVDWALNLLPGYIVGGQFALALIALVLIVGSNKVKKRRERKKQAKLHDEHQYGPNPPQEIPPGP
jgi:hypothetical protein